MNRRHKYEQVMWSCGLWPLTLRMAGLKLCASLRSELRSCWKPCSSAGEAAVGELCWDATCCSRHTLVRVTNNRSHSSNCTSYSTDRPNKSQTNTITQQKTTLSWAVIQMMCWHLVNIIKIRCCQTPPLHIFLHKWSLNMFSKYNIKLINSFIWI